MNTATLLLAQLDTSPSENLFDKLSPLVVILLVAWGIALFLLPFIVFSIKDSAQKCHRELVAIRKALNSSRK